MGKRVRKSVIAPNCVPRAGGPGEAGGETNAPLGCRSLQAIAVLSRFKGKSVDCCQKVWEIQHCDDRGCRLST